MHRIYSVSESSAVVRRTDSSWGAGLCGVVLVGGNRGDMWGDGRRDCRSMVSHSTGGA